MLKIIFNFLKIDGSEPIDVDVKAHFDLRF